MRMENRLSGRFKMEPFGGERILIGHFRVGRTDGVSLQISAWKEILTKAGAKVALVSGSYNCGADFEIPHLENQLDSEVYRVDEGAFDRADAFADEKSFKEAFGRISKAVENGVRKAVAEFSPTRMIISNIFSVGENIAAAEGILKVLDEVSVPTLLINHDLYWENRRYDHPLFSFVQTYLAENFPPKRSYISHACINSLRQGGLVRRKGVHVDLLPDSLDFNRVLQDKNAQCAKLLRQFGIQPEDIMVLQATRVVRRKNIELAVDFVRELSKSSRVQMIKKRGLYSGRGFDPARNKIVLVIAGYAERRDQWYLQKVIDYAKKQGVYFVHLDGAFNGYPNGHWQRKPGLLDLHIYADLVTYLSSAEGFGNQFLEAVLSKTPVVVFEYSVFQADIKPKGFEVISLGREMGINTDTGLSLCPEVVLKRAASQAVDLLTDPRSYRLMVEKNFEIGRENFSFENTLERFIKIMKPGYVERARRWMRNVEVDV